VRGERAGRERGKKEKEGGEVMGTGGRKEGGGGERREGGWGGGKGDKRNEMKGEGGR